VKFATLKSLIEARGGTARHFLFDAGYTVSVNIRDPKGALVILRFSHEWGDPTFPEDRIVRDLETRGIFLGEDDPTVQHEGVYVDA
jgi:hypothetical protein